MKLLTFYSAFISIYSLLENNSKTATTNNSSNEEDEYFINDMSEEDYINKNTEPFNNFFNLNENPSNNSYCTLCQTGINIILDTIIQEYKWKYLHLFCTLVCSVALRRDICYAAVGRYGPIVIENTLKRLLNAETICTFLYICKPSIEYESIEDYAKRILKTNMNKIINNNLNKELNTKIKSQFNFAQITDSHIQLDYQIGKVINCNIPLCCRDTPEELGFKNNKNHKGEDIKYSLKYGAVGKCDGNLEVLKSLSKEMKSKNIDFILFTGDYSAHDVMKRLLLMFFMGQKQFCCMV